MITCRDAKHLFCRYLDGELTASLQTELHAHRLQCNDCQNELALMEACGDVIGLDRREPTVSASFTDRVLLARRSRVKPVGRSWSRTLIVYGSPMAAAACIALMFSVVRPMPVQSFVAGVREAAPPGVRAKVLTRDLTSDDVKQLNAMPVSSANFDVVVGAAVEKSKDTVDSVRRIAEDMATLFHDSFSIKTEQLVAGYKPPHPEAAVEQVDQPAATSDTPKPDAANGPMDDTLRDPL